MDAARISLRWSQINYLDARLDWRTMDASRGGKGGGNSPSSVTLPAFTILLIRSRKAASVKSDKLTPSMEAHAFTSLLMRSSSINCVFLRWWSAMLHYFVAAG